MIDYIIIGTAGLFTAYNANKALKLKQNHKILAKVVEDIIAKSQPIGAAIQNMVNNNQADLNGDGYFMSDILCGGRAINSYIGHFTKNLGSDLQQSVNDLNSLFTSTFELKEKMQMVGLKQTISLGNRAVTEFLEHCPVEYKDYLDGRVNDLAEFTPEFFKQLDVMSIVDSIPLYTSSLKSTFAGAVATAGSSLAFYSGYDVEYVSDKTQELFNSYQEDESTVHSEL
jgi:hypothetical protein